MMVLVDPQKPLRKGVVFCSFKRFGLSGIKHIPLMPWLDTELLISFLIIRKHSLYPSNFR